MSTPKGHTPLETGRDVIRDLNRSLTNQERRPQVTKARDLLGPGFGATATDLLDWNSPSARFNGFWSSTNARNAPTATGQYLGLTVAAADGHVMQVAMLHEPTLAGVSRIYTRRLYTSGLQAPAYTDWEQVHPAPGAVPAGGVVFLATGAALPAGWAESTAVAPAGLRAIRKT